MSSSSSLIPVSPPQTHQALRSASVAPQRDVSVVFRPKSYLFHKHTQRHTRPPNTDSHQSTTKTPPKHQDSNQEDTTQHLASHHHPRFLSTRILLLPAFLIITLHCHPVAAHLLEILKSFPSSPISSISSISSPSQYGNSLTVWAFSSSQTSC